MGSNPEPQNYPSWLAREERTAHRVAVSWEATICSPTLEDAACRILDITHLGCRLSSEHPPRTGTLVTVAIPEFAGITGWIAWRSNGEVGIDFAHPMPTAVLDEIVRRNGALPH
jgi:hypothetical protein